MTIKISQQTENKLFNRKELVLETTYQGSTPNKKEIKKSIADLTKSKEDVIVIDKIDQLYGTTKSKIKAKIYNSPEELKKSEVINKKPKKKEEKKKE